MKQMKFINGQMTDKTLDEIERNLLELQNLELYAVLIPNDDSFDRLISIIAKSKIHTLRLIIYNPRGLNYVYGVIKIVNENKYLRTLNIYNIMEFRYNSKLVAIANSKIQHLILSSVRQEDISILTQSKRLLSVYNNNTRSNIPELSETLAINKKRMESYYKKCIIILGAHTFRTYNMNDIKSHKYLLIMIAKLIEF